jgi:hypothetical protein
VTPRSEQRAWRACSRGEGNRDRKEHSVQKIRNEGMRPLGVRAMLAALLLLLTLGCQGADTQAQKTFATPEAAVEALLDAIERDDVDALLGIFGREYQDAIVTPDWDAEHDTRQRILEAAKQAQELSQVDEGVVELIVGEEEWPFPIQIVQEEEG